MNRPPKGPRRAALTAIFALVVFVVLAITMLIVGGITLIAVHGGLLSDLTTPTIAYPIIAYAVASILIGTLIAAIISKVPLKPVNALIAGMNRLASGEFDARLDTEVHPIGRDVSESFNLLAEELENTEVLRSDFINNFSHEFKTPIVSIRGFARLMLRGNLPEQRQREYLEIIADEADRLAELATNILNLTKVENQSILTDTHRFNLSEQIRDAILLLEKKWTKKGLVINADFDEYEIEANEELLKEVWINLLDNSVKFSKPGGEVDVSIARDGGALTVSVTNHGPEISEEERRRMFDRFWQGDVSHAAEGTGIGLSIVKRIVQLHKGDIAVDSTAEATTFAVALPQ